MRRLILILFSLSASASLASVREVVTVFQALSYHGTDSVEEVDGELFQAGVQSFPLIVSGAMPEVMVEAIARPHRLPSLGEYRFKENNLLVLCKIALRAEMKDKELRVSFDVSKLSLPEEVECSARTVLSMAIKALDQTLRSYAHRSDEKTAYRVEIIGTNDKNESLKNLSRKVEIKK